MADVYAVSSAKGGVGKTTTAVNLAATLAAAGHDVLAIDGDIGTPNFGPALGVDPDGATLHDVLAGEATLDAATYEGPHGLRVVPGRDELSAFREADPGRLGAVIDQLSDAAYVIVDTSAGLTHDSALPIAVADGTLLVTTPDRDALSATRKTAALARELGGSVAGVALNRAGESDDAGMDDPVLGRIPDSDVIAAAGAAGEPITTYAPDSAEAAAYRRLASRLTVSRVTPPPGVDAASAADTGEATADVGVSVDRGADAEPDDRTPDASSAGTEADGTRTDGEPAGGTPRGTGTDDADRTPNPRSVDPGGGEPAVTPAAGTLGEAPETSGGTSVYDAVASDETDDEDTTAAGDATVLDHGDGAEDMVVAAGSEVEAKEEAKTVLGEPVPDDAIERTETGRGDAVEYEIDRDAIPFADDEDTDDEDDEDEDDRGFFSRLFGS